MKTTPTLITVMVTGAAIVVRVDDGDIQDTAAGGRGQRDRCVGDRDLGDPINAVGDPTPRSRGPARTRI